MINDLNRFSRIPHLSILIFSMGFCHLHAQTSPIAVPRDLTKASVQNTKSDYHLGPTGLRGWMHVVKGTLTPQDMSTAYSTAQARQILITAVEKGSPAEGILSVGDVILGIGKQPFSMDPRVALGQAIDEAEKEENQGALQLLRWRSDQPVNSETRAPGKSETVTLKLTVLGSYSATAPYDCPKSEAIRRQTVAAIYRDGMKGRLSLHVLALLATGDKKDLEKITPHIKSIGNQRVKVAVENIGEQNAWDMSYQAITLCEYYLMTHDASVLATLRDLIHVIAQGQSITGDWGHEMAGYKFNNGRLHGRLRGYGSFNQVSLPCYLALVLGQKCGLESPELTQALRRSNENFEYYIDKGAIPYGYHHPREYLLGNNGTAAMAAFAFSLQGNVQGSRFFSRLCAASADKVEMGHTGPFFNTFWTTLGASLGGPELATSYLKRWRWLQTMTRRWDGGFVYQYPGGDSRTYRGLNPNAANLLYLCLPQRKLFITGKNADPSIWLKGEAAEAIVDSREIDYAGADETTLLELLGHELPPVRLLAAKALAGRKGDFVAPLRALLKGTRNQKIGACHALAGMHKKAAPAVDDLMGLIRNDKEDLWIRIRALAALAGIGEPAQKQVPKLMQILIDHKPHDQRRSFEKSLGLTLVQLTPKPHAKTLDKTLNKQLRYDAALKLLDHPHDLGRTRGMDLIEDITLEEFPKFADMIVHVCMNDDVHYTGYTNDDPRAAGLRILERLNIAEGLELCVKTLDPHLWGQKYRLPGRLLLLKKYGSNATPYIPEIKALLGDNADAVIAEIEGSKVVRKLITIEQAKKTGRP